MSDNISLDKVVKLARDEHLNLLAVNFLEHEWVQCQNQALKDHIEDEDYNYQQRK